MAEDVLDLPEKKKIPKPRHYTMLLMTGIVIIMVAAVIQMLSFEYQGIWLFALGWLVLFTHFILRSVTNFKHYLAMCVRDLGRLGVITAITMKLFHWPFALQVMIASGLIYAIGYLGHWWKK